MDRGQSSVEYVALVALVAIVIALGTAGAAGAAPGIANAVGRGIHRALCVVTGDDCIAVREQPCVTASDGDDETVTVHAGFWRISDHAGILREELSDGSVKITEVDDLSGGGETGLGVHARMKIGRHGFDLGGELQAQAVASAGHARTYVMPDRHAADVLMERLTGASPKTLVADRALRYGRRLLGFGGDRHIPAADEVSWSAGAEASGSLSTSVGGADAGAGATAGWRRERRSGRRTIYLNVGGEAGGALRAAVADGRIDGGGALGVAVTYDRRHKPLALTVSAEGDASGSFDPAGRLAELPGSDRLAGAAAGRLEIEDRLDLTDPANAAAVRKLVSGLRRLSPSDAAAAAADVGRRLVRDGGWDIRAYRTESSSDGVGADAALGAKLGIDVDVVHSSRRLAAAWSRPAGGLWERRIDCLSVRA